MGICMTELQERTSHQMEGPPPRCHGADQRRAGQVPSGSPPPALLGEERLQQEDASLLTPGRPPRAPSARPPWPGQAHTPPGASRPAARGSCPGSAPSAGAPAHPGSPLRRREGCPEPGSHGESSGCSQAPSSRARPRRVHHPSRDTSQPLPQQGHSLCLPWTQALPRT